MNKNPLLSICIPTYNRAPYLKRLLDSIVCQKEFLNTNDVEIVIDDGPSKDNTEKLVKEYQDKHPNKIRYFRNDVAIGMCPAFLEAISFSNGKYTRLFGSDDFMSNNALAIILGIIKLRQPKIILSNRKETTMGEHEPFYDTNNLTSNVLNFNGFSDFSIYFGFDNKERYLDKVNYLTFISIFCFETDYYKNAYDYIIHDLKYSENELKTNYFNFSLIGFAKLYSNDVISLVENPILVFCEEFNHGWKPNKKIVSDLRILVHHITDNYPISLNCKKSLNKMLFLWKLSCNILPTTKRILIKIGIYKYFVAFYKKHFL